MFSNNIQGGKGQLPNTEGAGTVMQILGYLFRIEHKLALLVTRDWKLVSF